MPTTEQTFKLLDEFAKLPAGWHYGEGCAPRFETLKGAREFLSRAVSLGATATNAFPGVDGEIALTFYLGKKYLEVVFELNDTFTVTEEIETTGEEEKERNFDEVFYLEDATLGQAYERLEQFYGRS